MGPPVAAPFSQPTENGGQEPIVNQGAVVAPDAVVEGTEEEVTGLEEMPAPPTSEDVVAGNAAAQPAQSKRLEARLDCQGERLPTSPMLGVGGLVTHDDDNRWGVLVLIGAAGAALFVAGAAVRRRRSTAIESKPVDPLESVAMLVAVVGGVVGLAVTFFPGAAATEHPAPEATMEVREVHPRVTRNEYALRTGADRRQIPETDLREVGNVIWLQIALRGYAGKRPTLQYGLYRRDAEVLLPNTAKEVRLAVEDADEQTSFIPIWVGYPIPERFEAQFTLLEGRRVREMAKTGGMSGSTVRYACAKP